MSFTELLRKVVSAAVAGIGCLVALGGGFGLLKATNSAIAWSSSMQIQLNVMLVGVVLMLLAVWVVGGFKRR